MCASRSPAARQHMRSMCERGQEVVLQQNAVLQCLVPSLNLALCLRMIRRAAIVRHPFVFQIFS